MFAWSEYCMKHRVEYSPSSLSYGETKKSTRLSRIEDAGRMCSLLLVVRSSYSVSRHHCQGGTTDFFESRWVDFTFQCCIPLQGHAERPGEDTLFGNIIGLSCRDTFLLSRTSRSVRSRLHFVVSFCFPVCYLSFGQVIRVTAILTPPGFRFVIIRGIKYNFPGHFFLYRISDQCKLQGSESFPSKPLAE